MKNKSIVFALTLTLAITAAAWATQSAAQRTKELGVIVRLDPALDELLSVDEPIEILGEGFDWSEGPVWMPDGEYLLFSDIPRNHIVKWKEGEGTSVYMEPSGYTGKEPFKGREPGTNGLLLDNEGRLIMCCHGDRQVKRREKDGSFTILASEYDGQRLNSPNDAVVHSSGAIYFTDPPYGLPGGARSDEREMDYCGVFRRATDGTITLLTKEMTRPNGIGLSPDEKTLYVGQSDGRAPIWKAFPVKEDGTLGESRLLADGSKLDGNLKGGPDGLAIDERGNIWATGPGGVIIMTPEGKVLGRILTGQNSGNCTFGEDGKTLFIMADMYIVRVRTLVKGLGY